MQTEKKTFTKAEVEVILFEDKDVLTQSPETQSFTIQGPGPMEEDPEDNF